MVVYNFKSMTSVPTSDDFIDIVLTRTQRKTPTVVHPGYSINRIRSFYMRKVKFTSETFGERITQIITNFPRLDDIHPFYADLINILYDRDHYKLALGQLNMARQLINTLARDYVRLLKYADSLYRCKQLKVAALGRMCTVMKKNKSSLAYLEEVRKHMARLPSLDPTTRTLIITGYPNVGKSSFINNITNVKAEVEPYAFTTKSLYVGHLDYRYLRWQVIDTPGLLDHPLEDRNTIEMQAITALAHLPAAILYFFDISETCGYTILQQVNLFKSIKPLFANKQLVIVANKIDIKPFEQLSPDLIELLKEVEVLAGREFIKMSNHSTEGIQLVKNSACDLLLQTRIDSRLNQKNGSESKVNEIINRLTIINPKPRDTKVRGPTIPESVVSSKEEDKMEMEKKKTEKELMWENGGPGVYSCDYRKTYLLENDDWKFDIMPEIIEGTNIYDYVDNDISTKLQELEEEEGLLLEEQDGLDRIENEKLNETKLNEEEILISREIKNYKLKMRNESFLKNNNKQLNRKIRVKHGNSDSMVSHLSSVGYETEKIKESVVSSSRKRTRSDAEMEVDEEANEDAMDVDEKVVKKSKLEEKALLLRKKKSHLTMSQIKQKDDSHSIGLKDQEQVEKGKKIASKSRKKIGKKFALASESDKINYPHLMKWMNTGKSGLGTSTQGR